MNACQEWINKQLNEQELNSKRVRTGDANAELIGDEIKIISRSSAHYYMKLAGAEYDSSKQCYYTDKHEDPKNIMDRCTRFIPEKYRLLRRQAIYVKVKLCKATKEALKFTRQIYGIAHDAPIPVTRPNDPPGYYRVALPESADPDDMVKICIDFLDDSIFQQFVTYNKTTYGRPGEYLFDMS